MVKISLDRTNYLFCALHQLVLEGRKWLRNWAASQISCTHLRQMRRQSLPIFYLPSETSGPLVWPRQLLGHKRNNWQQTHPTIFSPSTSANSFYQGPLFSWERWICFKWTSMEIRNVGVGGGGVQWKVTTKLLLLGAVLGDLYLIVVGLSSLCAMILIL